MGDALTEALASLDSRRDGALHRKVPTPTLGDEGEISIQNQIAYQGLRLAARLQRQHPGKGHPGCCLFYSEKT